MAIEDDIFDRRAQGESSKNYEVTIEANIKDKEVLAKINQLIEQKLKEACVMVQDTAKQNCPVDTGRLQGSISYEMVSDHEGIVGSNVEYAPYVEAGTYKMSGRHYLQNAGDSNRQKIIQLFKGMV